MDKNMIHIDDLIRQRLSGEAQERSGAWGNMRELLDQKMPVASPRGGYNWRRMFGLVTGLALLATVTVGSYQIVTSIRSDKADGADKDQNAIAAGHKPAATATGIAGDKTVSAHEASAEQTAAARKSTIASGLATVAGVDPITTSSNSSLNKITSSNNPGNKPSTNSGRLTTHKNADGTVGMKAAEPSLITGTDQSSPASESVLASGNAATSQPDKIASNKDITGGQTVAKGQAIVAAGKAMQPAETYSNNLPDNTSAARQPAPQEPSLQKDSFRQMTVIKRSIINPLTRTSRYVTDTVSIERLAVDNAVISQLLGNDALLAEQGQAGADMELTPAASAKLNAAKSADDQLAGMVPLSNFKVKSQKTNKWNTRSFDEVMRDMKFNLSQVKFYPGVSAGGNSYMFGPHNMSGFQVGLFGLLTFGDNLSAMAELKYLHRFNGGATLKDNYTDIRESGTGTGYLQAEVEHFFKFSALQSIEMPLALRYAAGRVNFFGGMNIAYNFGVNPEEVTNFTADANYVHTNNPNWGDTKPRISYKDFNSRLALGALAGISYELSPSVQLDLRATKNVWDNSFGIGASKVSQELYRAPSFQFSLYYRFSQRNKIPKAK